MEIRELYNSFMADAKRIPGFVAGQKEDVPYDITELADMYLLADEEGDESAKSMYLSALVVRYWHMTTILYGNSKTLPIEREDVVDWLVDAILKALHYRSWLNPDKPISKDRKGAEKCINQCITSIRQWWFKNLNQLKRKGNKYLQSLDDSAYADSEDGRKTTVLDTVESYDDRESLCGELIDKALRDGDVLAGIIIDGIAYQDTFMDTVKTVENDDGDKVLAHGSEFSRQKLMKHLRSLTPGFIEYFAATYGADKGAVEEEASRLSSLKSEELNSDVRAAFRWIEGKVRLCM